MKDRIKKVRIEAGMNQAEFGRKISISRSAVWKIENGENTPSEQTLQLICGKFDVNEAWLRYGEGDMYKETEDEIAAVVSELLEEENPLYSLIIGIMKTYQNLDDASQSTLNDFVKNLFDNMKKEG